MGYNVVFLPTAEQNLNSIDEYLSQFYPSTAANFFAELDRKTLLLQEMPYMGTTYIHNEKYRRLLVGDYLVFYTIDENRKTVEIHRVLHGSQNITQHLL